MFRFFKQKKVKVTKELLNDLEEDLIRADIGVDLAESIVGFINKQKFDQELPLEEIKKIIANRLIEILQHYVQTLNIENKPTVLLIVGINGSGKTTTIGKLGNYYSIMGKKVLLAAGDTFRAGAVQQLQQIGEKLNLKVFNNPKTQDSASVIYQAYQLAEKNNYDLLIADTSGRLNNNSSLMDELTKIDKTLKKLNANLPHHTILVLDGTLGQTSINIAKDFKKAINIDTLIINKIDGNSKGGAILPICKELNLPIAFCGTGEKTSDIEVFNPQAFTSRLLQ